MPLSKANLEAVLALAVVVVQRHEQITQLANGIRGGTIYRSPDGQIAINITPDQLTEARSIITQLVDEADTASAGIRAILAEAPP